MIASLTRLLAKVKLFEYSNEKSHIFILKKLSRVPTSKFDEKS